MRITASEAFQRMKMFDKELTAYDFDGYTHVVIRHQDGSFMDLVNAFYMQEDCWIYVFSEHNGCHFFHKEDLVYLFQSTWDNPYIGRI